MNFKFLSGIKVHNMRRIGAIFVLVIMTGCGQNDKSGLTICCAGDSLMMPIPHYLRDMLKNSKGKVNIKDWSRGGLSSRTYQNYFARRSRRWQNTKPDFVLIQLGTNDVLHLLRDHYKLADFKENLSKIIRNFRRLKGNRYKTPKIFIASVPPFYEETQSEEENSLIQEKINPSIQEIAQKEKIIFVDNFSVLCNRIHLYGPDGVHPNPRGQRALTKNWLFCIRSELRKSSKE